MRRRNPRAAGFRSSIWRASPTRSKCRLRLCMEVVAIALWVICNSEWAGAIPKGNSRMLRKPSSNFFNYHPIKELPGKQRTRSKWRLTRYSFANPSGKLFLWNIPGARDAKSNATNTKKIDGIISGLMARRLVRLARRA
jgi:hypothetical protein